jgi:hypothetical protein
MSFTIVPLGYDRGVINTGQFINGLWMGLVLIAVALVPGFLDGCTRALSSFGNSTVFRMPSLVRRRFPVHTPVPAQGAMRPWVAALGMAVVLLATCAYIAR